MGSSRGGMLSRKFEKQAEYAVTLGTICSISLQTDDGIYREKRSPK